MTLSPEWTPLASACPVNTYCLLVTVCGIVFFLTDKFHFLARRADIEGLVGIVKEVGYAERIIAVAAPLLDMEHVVFDIRSHAVAEHVFVVLLRAVTAVGNDFLALHTVSGFERFQIVDHREGIGRALIDAEVGYELVFSGYLHFIAGVELTVQHRVLFHAHERGIGVGLGV